MHVLLVTPYYAPAYAFGGPVQVADVVVSGLLEAGHELTVATTDALDLDRRVPAGTRGGPPGADVHRFPNLNHRLAANAMLWTPRGFRRWIAREIERFDLVLLYDVYSVLSVVAARTARRAGVPYVMHPHGSLAPTPERGRAGAKRIFLALWGRRAIAGAAGLLHATEHEGREFLEEGARPDQLIAMALPLDLPVAERHAPAGPAETPTLVSLGRLDPIKGFDEVIAAMPAIRSRVPGATLEIAGGPSPYRERLERLVASLELGDAVRFVGFVEGEAKVRFLRRGWVFVLLSRSEGLPIAAVEAMACGLPVVLSRACHLDEIDGRAGVVVGDQPADRVDAIVQLLGDQRRRGELAEGAVRFSNAFRRERVVPDVVRTFERLSRRHPGKRSTQDPRVAVVIPCFNDGATLTEAVRSVSEAEPVELVVVDDGSTDAHTLEVLGALERDGVQVVHRANGGLAAARMTGVARTTAPYVFPLDADDRAVAGALAPLADLLDADERLGWVYGDFVTFGDHRGRFVSSAVLDPWAMTYANFVPVSSLIRREALVGVGGWTLDGPYEDWDLWLALIEAGWDARRLDRVVYERRVHGVRMQATARRRHAQIHATLRHRHPRLFDARPALRRASPSGTAARALIPVLFGARNRNLVPPTLEARMFRWRTARALRGRGDR